MSVQAKYQRVLELGEALGVQNGSVVEENGVLKVAGTVKTPYEKNLMWDVIKSIGGDAPADIIADINPTTSEYFHKHVVTDNDTLSKIAKHYYGDMMKYPVIFEANKPMLSHPDKIYPGQVLRIPAL